MSVMPIADFKLKGEPPRSPLRTLVQRGATGSSRPLCNTILPVPFGNWQNDYMSAGMPLPAGEHLPAGSEVQCADASVDIECAGAVLASTSFWLDRWTPNYPLDGSTRCGSRVVIKAELHDQIVASSGLRLAWVAELRNWKRERDYGEYKLHEWQCFLLDR